MKIWTERPSKTDVEAVVRRYFSLLRAGNVPEAEQLVGDHPTTRHVLKSLWAGSVGVSVDANETSCSRAADEWKHDLSWLGELDLVGFNWGHTGSHFYVEVTHRAQVIEVSLGFWVKPTDAGWVVAGPSTLW
ncbi:hypothetical protein HD597_009496 [Nonomuraea thailandensis]|uniref:Uncharacterized protein n=1 Tax=Nonomuraea thailandensis TaxID=1188745 RepID=A0A9X2GVF6_9ACTN|nr:hypothetical protein [Nonomuraea thailandensis]MCP2362476.1 hypothetical protein [Nonomuraea thailandensis]